MEPNMMLTIKRSKEKVHLWWTTGNR